MLLAEIESAKRMLYYVYLGFSVEVGIIEKLFFVGENKIRCDY